jgi:hypothetical protein
LEKLIHKRSRSIDIKNKITSLKGKRRAKHLSEDKQTKKYIFLEKPKKVLKKKNQDLNNNETSKRN